jgi:hypothetical protein
MAFRANSEILADTENLKDPDTETLTDTLNESLTEKENKSWMMAQKYMTTEEATRTTSEKGLPAETKLLIDYVAKSIAASMLTQLEQAADVSHQYTNSKDVMYGRTSVEVFDRVVRDMFNHNLFHTLGIHRTIIVDIVKFIGKPLSPRSRLSPRATLTDIDGENDLTAALKRNNWDLVPTRLIQKLDTLTREASTEFANAFSLAVTSAFSEGVAAVPDPRLSQIFVRQQAIHRGTNDIPPEKVCCLFKILEEDFEMPYDKSKLDGHSYKYLAPQSKAEADTVFKHMLCQFSIKCSTCGGKSHEFKVVR